MKITQVETVRLGEFPNIIWIRLHTDEGITGLGETFMGAQAVEALENALPFKLTETRGVLRDHGNMSSPSVLFALERRLAGGNPDDKRLWLTAFGAGFAAHACELWR